MTFTVRSLLDIPEAQTVSLTPGVGEDRAIRWAHVSELADPTNWVGEGALLLTTGIPVPATTDDQCAYLEGLSSAGIVGIAIDAKMPAHPFTQPSLAYAAHLGFPVLEVAHEVPFVSIAKLVADASNRAAEHRVRETERLYAALSEHRADAPIDTLLASLGEVLGSPLALVPTRGQAAADKAVRIRPTSDGRLAVTLTGRGAPTLVGGAGVNPELLQHAAGVLGTALAVKVAAHRMEWMHGSLLLASLCDTALPSAASFDLIAAYGLEPPFIIAVSRGTDPAALLDEAQAQFQRASTAALATVKDSQVVLLSRYGEESDAALTALVGGDTSVGVSAKFTSLEDVQTALRQARSALIRNHQSGKVLRFEEHEPTSLFLPNSPEQLRSIANQVLGPLRIYDRQRGTALTHTLRVFLEENRSWVRASERLYVHRQTLIARVSRIEKIIGRDLSSMEDAAECWLAVQAAIGCGDLASNDPAQQCDDEETEHPEA